MSLSQVTLTNLKIGTRSNRNLKNQPKFNKWRFTNLG